MLKLCSSDLALSNIGLRIDSLDMAMRDYLLIYFIRNVEMKIADEYAYGLMRTPVHLCVGQEAIPAGISRFLFHEDKVFSNHRSHGHYLSKGGDLQALFAELLGKESGCARGRGGSQHLIDLDANFIASAPILGGTVPVGAGAAYSNGLKGSTDIVVVYLGDAVLEEGILYETLSFAALKSLQILFVVENNRLSVHTHLQLRQPVRELTDIGKAFGVKSFQANGNDVREISRVTQDMMQILRGEKKPVIAIFETFRTLEHVGPKEDFNLGYRNREEDNLWLKRDPLQISLSYLGELTKAQESLKTESEMKIQHYIAKSWSNALNSAEAKSDNE